jgi:2,4-dienoyl-CoA reductase-like NADH-dependent reductase (Old Yellow Enzyme family)
VRAAWPADKPMFVRISATDWLDDEGGFTVDDTCEVRARLKRSRLRRDRRVDGRQRARVEARVRPHVPGAVRRAIRNEAGIP